MIRWICLRSLEQTNNNPPKAYHIIIAQDGQTNTQSSHPPKTTPGHNDNQIKTMQAISDHQNLRHARWTKGRAWVKEE